MDTAVSEKNSSSVQHRRGFGALGVFERLCNDILTLKLKPDS